MSWRDRALCRADRSNASDPYLREVDGVIAEAFFARKDSPMLTLARRVCAACPVATECLTEALDELADHTDFGIRAGFTEAQRKQLRRLPMPVLMGGRA